MPLFYGSEHANHNLTGESIVSQHPFILFPLPTASKIFDNHLNRCAELGYMPITLDQCVDWVTCIAEDTLCDAMRWATSANLTDSLMEKLFPGLNKVDTVFDIRELIQKEIREPILSYVTNEWMIYDLTLKMGTIFITPDIDYRIRDWHRLTGTPE